MHKGIVVWFSKSKHEVSFCFVYLCTPLDRSAQLCIAIQVAINKGYTCSEWKLILSPSIRIVRESKHSSPHIPISANSDTCSPEKNIQASNSFHTLIVNGLVPRLQRGGS